MKKTMYLVSAAALCASFSPVVAADITLRLVNTQDLSLVCDSVNAPTFFVGNNPSVISLVGDNLFVAGYRGNNVTTDLVATTGQMVKIEDIFGVRAFRTVPSSQVTLPGFRGFYGLQYDYGPARRGVVLNYDSGGIGTAGAFKLYDVDTQLNPILVASSPAGTSPRGGAGAAFDYGASGLGFDTDADPMTASVPVVSILDFSGYPGSIQNLGPFGVTATDLAPGTALNVIQGRIYDGTSVDGSNNSIAPVINTPGTNSVTVSGTLWRDLSIDPRNGNLAARADNDVIIARRNALNGNGSHVVLSCDVNAACGSVPFQIMQRVELLWGSPAGDVVLYNQYRNGATGLAGWIKGADLDGNAVTVNFTDANGLPFDVANAGGTYDISWDATNGRVAICDFGNRAAYIFEIDTPSTCPACAADYDLSGGVDGSDVEAFFNDWTASAPCADVDQSGGVDGSDVEAFFFVWGNGGC